MVLSLVRARNEWGVDIELAWRAEARMCIDGSKCPPPLLIRHLYFDSLFLPRKADSLRSDFGIMGFLRRRARALRPVQRPTQGNISGLHKFIVELSWPKRPQRMNVDNIIHKKRAGEPTLLIKIPGGFPYFANCSATKPQLKSFQISSRYFGRAFR
jgi:hypothetical protein